MSPKFKPMPLDATANLLASEFWGRMAKPRFRGEIYEDDTENEHLKDFLACHFHRKILRDAVKDTTRRMGLRAANQIGKTRIGELILKHLMKYRPANMIVYDETIEKSRDHMANRFGPMLASIFGDVFKEVIENNRFDISTQDIRLPGMIFRARPLNEAWTQSITIKYGMISDAALCDPRQIRRAFVRSRQHEHDDFWFVESQGDAVEGRVGGGFREFMSTTNEMKLWVRCLHCGTRQRFLFHHLRMPDTVIVAPLSVPSLDREAWVAHHKPILLSEERCHAGFKVAGELKRDDGSFNEQEIMKSTVYECPHCGDIWNDDGLHGKMRRYLDREAGLDENWIVTNPKALPGYLGYSLPVWINPKISWGSAMLFFRQAMAAFNSGNMMNLQEWRTKWEGEDWNKSDESRITFKAVTDSPEWIKDKKACPNERFRMMLVDCQKDKEASDKAGKDMTGHFWATATAVDIAGNCFQLWRGYCTSWKEWIEKYKELEIPVENVLVDGRYQPDQIREMAAVNRVEYGPKVWRNGRWEQPMKTWKIMIGDARNRWLHTADNVPRVYSAPEPKPVSIRLANGEWMSMSVPWILWSNWHITNMLNLLRSGAPGRAQFVALPPESELLSAKTREMERFTDEKGHKKWSYDNQMNGQMLGEGLNKKAKWIDLHKEQHYCDCAKMGVVLMLMAGYFGAVEIADDEQAAVAD